MHSSDEKCLHCPTPPCPGFPVIDIQTLASSWPDDPGWPTEDDLPSDISWESQ